MDLIKKLITSALFLLLAIWIMSSLGWIEITPSGKKVGQSAFGSVATEVKKGTVWLLETLFEDKDKKI